MFLILNFLIFKIFSLSPDSQLSFLRFNPTSVQFDVSLDQVSSVVQDISLSEFATYLSHRGDSSSLLDSKKVSTFRHLYFGSVYSQTQKHYDLVGVENLENAIEASISPKDSIQFHLKPGELIVENESQGVSLSDLSFLFVPYLSFRDSRVGQGHKLNLYFLKAPGDFWEFSFYEPNHGVRLNFLFEVKEGTFVHTLDRQSLDHIRVSVSVDKSSRSTKTRSRLSSSSMTGSQYDRIESQVQSNYRFYHYFKDKPQIVVGDQKGSWDDYVRLGDTGYQERLSFHDDDGEWDSILGNFDGEPWSMGSVSSRNISKRPSYFYFIHSGRVVFKLRRSSDFCIDYVVNLPSSVKLASTKDQILWSDPVTLRWVREFIVAMGESYLKSPFPPSKPNFDLPFLSFLESLFKSSFFDTDRLESLELKQTVLSALFYLQASDLNKKSQKLYQLPLPLFNKDRDSLKEPYSWSSLIKYFFESTCSIDTQEQYLKPTFLDVYSQIFLGISSFLEGELSFPLKKNDFRYFDLISRLRLAISLIYQDCKFYDESWVEESKVLSLYRILEILSVEQQDLKASEKDSYSQFVYQLYSFFEENLKREFSSKGQRISSLEGCMKYEGIHPSSLIRFPLKNKKKLLSQLGDFRDNLKPLSQQESISDFYGQSRLIENRLFHISSIQPSFSTSFSEILMNSVEAGASKLDIDSYHLLDEKNQPTGRAVFEFHDNANGINRPEDVLVPFLSTKSEFEGCNFGWGIFLSLGEGDEMVIHSIPKNKSFIPFTLYLTRRNGEIFYSVQKASDSSLRNMKGHGTSIYWIRSQKKLNMDGHLLFKELFSKIPFPPLNPFTHTPIKVYWPHQIHLPLASEGSTTMTQKIKNVISVPLFFSFDLFSEFPEILAHKDEILADLTRQNIISKGYIIRPVSAHTLSQIIEKYVTLDSQQVHVIKLRLRDYLNLKYRIVDLTSSKYSQGGGVSRSGIVSMGGKFDWANRIYNKPCIDRGDKDSFFKQERRSVFLDYPYYSLKNLESSDSVYRDQKFPLDSKKFILFLDFLSDQQEAAQHPRSLFRFDWDLRYSTKNNYGKLDISQEVLVKHLSQFFLDDSLRDVLPSLFWSENWAYVKMWMSLSLEEQHRIYALIQLEKRSLSRKRNNFERQLMPEIVNIDQKANQFTQFTMKRGQIAESLKFFIQEVFSYGELHVFEFLKRLDPYREYMTPELTKTVHTQLVEYLSQVYIKNISLSPIWNGVPGSSKSYVDSQIRGIESYIQERLSESVSSMWEHFGVFRLKSKINFFDYMKSCCPKGKFSSPSLDFLWEQFYSDHLKPVVDLDLLETKFEENGSFNMKEVADICKRYPVDYSVSLSSFRSSSAQVPLLSSSSKAPLSLKKSRVTKKRSKDLEPQDISSLQEVNEVSLLPWSSVPPAFLPSSSRATVLLTSQKKAEFILSALPKVDESEVSPFSLSSVSPDFSEKNVLPNLTKGKVRSATSKSTLSETPSLTVPKTGNPSSKKSKGTKKRSKDLEPQDISSLQEANEVSLSPSSSKETALLTSKKKAEFTLSPLVDESEVSLFSLSSVSPDFSEKNVLPNLTKGKVRSATSKSTLSETPSFSKYEDSSKTLSRTKDQNAHLSRPRSLFRVQWLYGSIDTSA